MARTPSTMLDLGVTAPDFTLPEPLGGETRSLTQLKGEKGTLVIFICNHCPFVLHILDSFVEFAAEYQSRGLNVVAISANDVSNYPDDSPEKMAQLAQDKEFTFPYLYDATQEVAKAYQAACTPDLYLFDDSLKLVYRGQYDAARPGNDIPVTGEDLRRASDALLDGAPLPADQIPSLGCNIKWKAGNEPEYFG
ncbi:MAG: thioredoxin family protein [Gammaproteobacteria bacterium]|nr:thioredoxin family protein [Gammaproteobacteria bacterium]